MAVQSSKAFRWTVRAIVWCVALFLMIPMLGAGIAFRTVDTMEECNRESSFGNPHAKGLYAAQRFTLCMFLKGSYLESRSLEPALRDVMALRTPPCEFVGIWKSARARSVYRITMRDDNTFSGEAVVDYGPTRDSDSANGYWGENQGRMVWIYDKGVAWPPDINRIAQSSADKFTLIEVNGERTEFTRERELESARCGEA